MEFIYMFKEDEEYFFLYIDNGKEKMVSATEDAFLWAAEEAGLLEISKKGKMMAEDEEGYMKEIEYDDWLMYCYDPKKHDQLIFEKLIS